MAKQKILETIKEHILILMRVCLNQAGRLCEIGGDFDWAGNIFKIKEGYIFKIKSIFKKKQFWKGNIIPVPDILLKPKNENQCWKGFLTICSIISNYLYLFDNIHKQWTKIEISKVWKRYKDFAETLNFQAVEFLVGAD